MAGLVPAMTKDRRCKFQVRFLWASLGIWKGANGLCYLHDDDDDRPGSGERFAEQDVATRPLMR